MPKYMLRITQRHDTFRFPSLLSISQLYDFPINFVSSPEDYFRGVLIVELEKEEHVQKFLDRGILVLWVAEVYAQADNYTSLAERLKENIEFIRPYQKEGVFKISPESCNLRMSSRRERELAMSFGYLGLEGPVDLKNPQVEFVVFEDYDLIGTATKSDQLSREGQFRQVYFGRRIGYSRARPLVHAHAVKTREYYGNTAMESEMGFLMAIQTLAAPGRIVYDPFVGTGSLLYACARFGAMVMGSDIDGRQMKGKNLSKGVAPGIVRAATQYGVESELLGCATFDVTRNPWRRGGWMDAIITDPPYGVRAGAKRLGKNPAKGRETREEAYILEDGTPAHTKPDYIPPQRPYEMMHLIIDLIKFARYMLIPKGRLVFFLPTVTEDYDAVDIPFVDGMKELKWGEGSVQDFNKWGRRLVTMEKTAQDEGPVPSFNDYSLLEGLTAGHDKFAKRYAEGFKPKKT